MHSPVVAQADGSRAELPTKADLAGDEEWQSLQQAKVRPELEGSASGGEAPGRYVDDLLDEADKLADFRQRNPAHAKAGEARRQQTLKLLQAAWGGDTTRQAQRAALVAEVRADKALSPGDRSEVAALADNLAVRQQASLSRQARLEEYEKVVRGLISEFPDVPTGYESLLRLAEAQSDEVALRVAREMQETSATPEFVRSQAQSILRRGELVGKQLEKVLADVETGGGLASMVGHPVILYSWATWSPRSVELVRKLVREAPPDAYLLGVNFDEDLSAAKTLVAETGIKGAQLYDQSRRDGPIAKALGLAAPGVVFVADAQGRIVTTTGHRDLKKALTETAK